MIDIHSHILPRVDDGSDNMAMSIEIANLYVENGIDKVICTPHYIEGADSPSSEEIRIHIEELKKELFKAAIPLEIYSGNEVYVTPNIVSKILEGEVLTLNNSSYVLIELPMNDMPIYAKDLIYELKVKGITPIIAHPERYSSVIEDPNILYEFINMGALAQLNLPSLEGLYGKRAKEVGAKLLEHNMIHFVGTDTHSNRRRSPRIKKSLEILSSLVSSSDFEILTTTNAQRVLNNEEIQIKSPRKISGKNHKLSYLTGLFAGFNQ